METFTEKNLPITAWAEDDRPRDKLMNKGRAVLSDAELVAILLGTGSADETALDLAKKILIGVSNNLHDLFKLTVTDLMKYKGIGSAKAATILAALELGRRRKHTDACKKEKITTSADAYNILRPLMLDLPHEEFWVLFLSRSNTIIRKEQISRGGVSGTVVDSKIIFKCAIENLANTIILAHNHPSNSTKPSVQDTEITKKLSAAGKLVEIPIIDHLIVCESGYYSFADEGVL
jgi:DNA repair protein RadC